MKKGQMFIVTMVFLTGLIFSVQQIMFHYSYLDVSKPFQRTDFYLLKNVEDIFGQTISSSTTCPEALSNLEELHHYLYREDLGGYALELTYNGQKAPNLNCSAWPAGTVLELGVRIIGPESESTQTYTF